MVQLNFNAATVAPAKPMEPVPADWYNVLIDESEIKVTNAGDGSYLRIRQNIIDGPYANQKIWHSFNIDNPNPKTVQIAYEQLSAICYAVGVIDCKTSELLHNKPFQVKVILKPPTTNTQTGQAYEASNDCKAFKAIANGAGPASGGATNGGGASTNAPAWAGNKGETATTEDQGAPVQDTAVAQTEDQPWQQQQQVEEQKPIQQQDNTVVSTQTSTESNVEGTDEKPPWMQ